MADNIYFKRADLAKWMNNNIDLIRNFEAMVTQLQAVQICPLPVGFVYTQGPGDTDPNTLWPQSTWSNVSSEEAGAFHRYEGGSASDFNSGSQSFAASGSTYINYTVRKWRRIV